VADRSEPVDSSPVPVGAVVHGEPFVLGEQGSTQFSQATWLDRAYPDHDPDFPEALVEGFWLLSMVDAVSRLAEPAGRADIWGLNYGLDRVRFISPVHFGDRIESTFEVLEVVPKGPGWKVLRRCTFQVEGHDDPAMIADWWTFVLPRGVKAP
jgi:acyl dehydratase